MTFYSRSAWGARPSKGGPGGLVASRVEGIALHWPAMSKPLRGVDAVSAALRGWQDYHMDGRGWSDIAYQEAIDQDGNVYHLRGITTQSGANGDQDVNQRYGALLLILAPDEKPTPEMVAAVRGRVAAFRKHFPNGKKILGHTDVRPEPTACPGPAALALIRSGAFEPRRRVVFGKHLRHALRDLREARAYAKGKGDGRRTYRVQKAMDWINKIRGQ